MVHAQNLWSVTLFSLIVTEGVDCFVVEARLPIAGPTGWASEARIEDVRNRTALANSRA